MEINLTNKFVLGTVALLVGIIVCTMAMVPAISDASTITYTNDDPSWVKLSEYDDVGEIPWTTLTFSVNGNNLTISQDGHNSTGRIEDMILFACVGEGDSTQITCIQDGMIKVLSRSSKGPYGSADIPLNQWVYPINGTSVTKNENYLVMSTTSGSRDIFHYGYQTSSVSFHYDQVDSIVVPNYNGNIRTFDHGSLWTDMEDVYAVGSLAGVVSIGDVASYRVATGYNWDNGLSDYKPTYSNKAVNVTTDTTQEENKLISVDWTAVSDPGTSVAPSNPSTSYITDPVIPSVPVSLIPANDPNYQWSGDWGYAYNSDDSGNGLTLVRYTGSGGAITIPSEILDSGSNTYRLVTRIGAGEGHPVFDNTSIQNNSTIAFQSGGNYNAYFMSINSSAFQGCTRITGAVDFSDFNNGLEIAIGDYAFMGSGITSFSGSSAWTIGRYAFAGCTSLTTLPDTFGSDDILSEGAFMNCTSVTSLVPFNIYNAPAYCFYGCNSLYSLDVTGSVGAMAFKNCTGITYLSVSCTTIGYEGFYGCTNVITEASSGHGYLNITADSVDTRAFYNLGADSSDHLGLLRFTDSIDRAIQWIGDSAFEGANIVGVDLSANTQLTGIWNRAFANTHCGFALLPSSLTAIGNETFRGTDLSDTLVIQKNVASIGDYAFADTDIGYVIDESSATISPSAFDNTPVTEVLSVNDREYTCFGNAEISNTIDADMYLAPQSISILRKDAVVTMMGVVPLVFLAGMVMFALWIFTKRSDLGA